MSCSFQCVLLQENIESAPTMYLKCSAFWATARVAPTIIQKLSGNCVGTTLAVVPKIILKFYVYQLEQIPYLSVLLQENIESAPTMYLKCSAFWATARVAPTFIRICNSLRDENGATANAVAPLIYNFLSF